MRLIREAFLRGISTRQVGRGVGVLTGEVAKRPDHREADPQPGSAGEGLSPSATEE